MLKIGRFIKDKQYRFNICSALGIYNHMNDEKYLKKQFGLKFDYLLNLNDPKTFNEKLNWLKINDRKPLYTILADKYKVKKFVSNLIGEEHIVPCLGVYENIDAIPWDKLPNEFVIKANHDSSGAIVCKDKSKLEIHKIRKKYNRIMKKNYYYACREWPYKNIRPCILIDQLLSDNTSNDKNVSLRDYKFWCFNGEPKFMYCTVKGTTIYENFYDMEYKEVTINHGFPRRIPEIDKPIGFEKMKEMAGILAKASQSPFIRVDFFDIKGHIYFGEYTFYDWAGMRPFISYEQDLELGALIDLSKFLR